MGVSTNGQLSYGVVFDEGYEFPWDVDWDGDADRWWRSVNNFVNPYEYPYDDVGNIKPGMTEEQRDKYWRAVFDWDKANPLPVEIVNYCSGDCAMYLLAVKGFHFSASRGYPEAIDIDDLTRIDDAHKVLTDFMARWGISGGEPMWWLSSYWG